jgi:O-methyltransferase involved in polyketide biosynthesis
MKIKLTDNEATLFLPLLGRALESKKVNPIFFDPLAADVIARIDYDFESLQNQISAFSSISWSVRALKFATIASQFISSHPDAAVINLGAGLDTTFYLVDNGKIDWFNIDSAEVNALRNALLPANPRVTNLNGSVLDPKLFDFITTDAQDVLFIASGLLLYFSAVEIKQLFNNIADQFPSSTIAFDRISTDSIQYIQTDLTKTNLTGAKIKWGLDDAQEIEKWDSRYRIIREETTFAGISRASIQATDVVNMMDMNDQNNGSGIVILHFD